MRVHFIIDGRIAIGPGDRLHVQGRQYVITDCELEYSDGRFMKFGLSLGLLEDWQGIDTGVLAVNLDDDKRIKSWFVKDFPKQLDTEHARGTTLTPPPLLDLYSLARLFAAGCGPEVQQEASRAEVEDMEWPETIEG